MKGQSILSNSSKSEKSSLVNSTTTIQLNRRSLGALSQFRQWLVDKGWDEAVMRAIRGEGEVFIDFLTVDGELAKAAPHTIIFQLGDDPPRYYKYEGGRFLTIEKLPRMEVKEMVVSA